MSNSGTLDSAAPPTAPAQAPWVLASLILVAAVANLNLSVANVALPDIGKYFDSSQTTLDLIAVGYSLGLACSVLWLGALGDRYGRKLMAVLGTILAIPFSLLAALAPSDTVLALARLGGGVAAGMAYPTTLALITALWSGPRRTRAIALWADARVPPVPEQDEERRLFARYDAESAATAVKATGARSADPGPGGLSP
jgi:MFS family permease